MRQLEEDRWWHFLLAVLLMPVTVPLFLLLAFGSIPVAVVHSIGHQICERRFRRRLRNEGRWLEWDEVESRLSAGEGTLLVEQAQKMPIRIWWTPDSVLNLAPALPPRTEDLDILGVFPPHPFVTWCNDCYFDPNHGTAFLTEPSLALPAGLFFSEFFRKHYPEASVMDTVYYREVSGEQNVAPDCGGVK